MVVPKVMVWAFEGKAEAMEEHCKSLEDVIEFAGSLDIPSLQFYCSEGIWESYGLDGTSSTGWTSIPGRPQNATKLEVALNSIATVTQSLKENVQPAICAGVLKRDRSGKPLLIDLERLSAVSRFLRVDAYFWNDVPRLLRLLPPDVLKLGNGKKKKKKKGKKGKKERTLLVQNENLRTNFV